MKLNKSDILFLKSLNTQTEYKRKELLLKILKAIAAGGAVAALFVAPNIGLLFKYWKLSNRREQKQIRDKIYYLLKRGYIQFDPKRNKYFLTSKGSIYLHKNEIKNLKPKKKKWDKKWRLLFFDIPEHKKQARVVLRDKIIEWGFVGVQKSIFLSKVDCKNELEKLKNYFDLSEEIILLEFDDSQMDKDLKKVYSRNKKLYNKK